MNPVFQSWWTTSRVLIVVMALALSACGSPGPRRDLPSTRAGEAEAAYQAGRFVEAAQAFASQAQRRPGERDTWLIRAADAAWQAGDLPGCRRFLLDLDQRGLSPQDRALGSLLEVLSEDGMPAHRMLSLLSIPDAFIPAHYRPLLHEVRAEALLAAGQPYPSARERIALAPWLVGQDSQRRNREAILAALQQMSTRQVTETLVKHPPQEEIYGWLSLVHALKTRVFEGEPAALVIDSWRRHFPGHPANEDSIATLLEGTDLGFEQPDRTVLLLPLSDPRLRPAAEAVRDGFFSAYYADQQHHSEIVVLDTAGDPQQALALYRRAIREGASQVVGPLDRDSVTAILLEADGRVPVLALNYQEGEAPAADGTYQFGLQPEEEAYAAAERMLEHGHWRAVALTPSNGWGARMENAFVARFEQLGGQVLGRYRYNETEVDYGAVIQQAVGVTEARLRERQLQRLVGQELSFDPQPRHDMDAIFIAARPRQARQIKPQLAFYNAGNMPAYATSHIYAGRADADADRDLNGMRFCDAPWLLGAQSFQPSLGSVRDVFSAARGSDVRLFAVGIDAYRLLPYLSWLARYRNDSFPGVTGQLSLDGRNRIRRRLDCAVFRGGVAEYEPLEVESTEFPG